MDAGEDPERAPRAADAAPDAGEPPPATEAAPAARELRMARDVGESGAAEALPRAQTRRPDPVARRPTAEAGAPLFGGRPLAPWRLRAGASLIDLGIAVVLVQVAGAILGAAGAANHTRTLFLIFGTIVVWGLAQTIEMGLSAGQTIGKRIFGLRVLRRDGTPAGLRDGALRELVCRLPYVVPLVFVVDAFLPLRADRRSMRDRMAGTGVVAEPPAATVNRPRTIATAMILVAIGCIVGAALNGDLISNDRDAFISDCTGRGEAYSACDCTWKHLTKSIGAKRLDQVSNEDVTPGDVQAATSAAYAACR